MAKRILIVDDDELSSDVLKALLDTHTDIDTAIDETDSGELATVGTAVTPAVSQLSQVRQLSKASSGQRLTVSTTSTVTVT